MTTNSPNTSDSSQEVIKPGYVRVSTILAAYQDFSHIDPEVLARKCVIGTEVHSAIESHFKKEFCPISSGAKEYMGAFKSALNGEFGDYNPKLLEQRMYSLELKTTGKIDMLAETEEGRVLVDYKTSAKVNLPVWSLQMAMYGLLLAHNEVFEVREAKVLHLKKKGKYSLISIPLTSELNDLAHSAVKLYFHFNPQK